MEKCTELETIIERNDEISLLSSAERKRALQATVKHADATSLMTLIKEKEECIENYKELKQKFCDKEIQKLRDDLEKSIRDLVPIQRKSDRIQSEIDDIKTEIDDLKLSKQYDDVLEQRETIEELREKITEEMRSHHDLKQAYYEIKQSEPIDINSAPELIALESRLAATRKSFEDANQRYLELRNKQIQELETNYNKIEERKRISERQLVRNIYSTRSVCMARTARSVKSSASSRRSARPVVENVGIICVKYFDVDVPGKVIHRMFDRYGKICGIDKRKSQKSGQYKVCVTFMRKAAAIDAVGSSVGLKYGNRELEVYLYNKAKKVENVEFHLDDTVTVERGDMHEEASPKVVVPPLDLSTSLGWNFEPPEVHKLPDGTEVIEFKDENSG